MYLNIIYIISVIKYVLIIKENQIFVLFKLLKTKLHYMMSYIIAIISQIINYYLLFVFKKELHYPHSNISNIC